jgi:hypothetical protein
MTSSTSSVGAASTSSQVAYRFRSSVKALKEFVSAVFCERIVRISSLTVSTRGPAHVGCS